MPNALEKFSIYYTTWEWLSMQLANNHSTLDFGNIFVVKFILIFNDTYMHSNILILKIVLKAFAAYDKIQYYQLQHLLQCINSKIKQLSLPINYLSTSFYINTKIDRNYNNFTWMLLISHYIPAKTISSTEPYKRW